MSQPGEQRFLVIRLGSLGDLVHTLPAVAALRSSFPNSRIDWVVERKWLPLVELASGIDRVIPWDRGVAGTVRCVSELRRNRYNCALDFQGLYKSAFLARLSGASQRIGLHSTFAREPGSSILYTNRVIPKGKHAVEMAMSLSAGAGAEWPARLKFPLAQPAEEKSALLETLAREGISEFYVISPGGGWTSKCWPAQRYGELCRELSGKMGVRVIVNSGPGEDAIAAKVVEAARPSKPFVYSPRLRELVPMLAMAKLVVAADTGPLHLAAALGTRLVALFGPTDPDRNGPMPQGKVLRRAPADAKTFKRGDYPRGSSYDPTMLALSVEEVLAAVEQELRFQP